MPMIPRMIVRLLVFGATLFAPLAAVWAAENRDGVAVIIGNANYRRGIPKVEYAHRDADAIRSYVIDVLGYDPDNIIDLRDATKAEIESAFGNERSHKGKLWRYIDPSGGSDVMVFYSGHGVPGQRDGRGYLLPVNGDPDTAEINGYSIDTLYANLAKLEARSVTVLLDACFSGESPRGMLIRSASPLYLKTKPTEELPGDGKLTILTAASSGQLASWDEQARHGLFTRHFLDGVYGKADQNGDRVVTLGEMKSYLDRTMTRAARRAYGRDQRASARGRPTAVLARLEAREAPPKAAPMAAAPAKPVAPPPPKPAAATPPQAPVAPRSTPAALTAPAAPAVKEDELVNPIQALLSALTGGGKPAPEKAKPPAAVAAGSLDGEWADDRGLSITVKGDTASVFLNYPEIQVNLDTTIDPATGAFKSVYANFNQSSVVVRGRLDAVEVEFTGRQAYNSYSVKLKKN